MRADISALSGNVPLTNHIIEKAREYADRTKTPFPDIQVAKIRKTAYENGAKYWLYNAEIAALERIPYGSTSARAHLETAKGYANEIGIDITEELHRIESIIRPPTRPIHGKEIA